MAVWIKKNGNEIEINDLPETVKYAESLGWVRKGEKKKKVKRNDSRN